jgi:hypothetical protein
LRFFIAVNRLVKLVAGIWTVHAENCSLAWSNRWGGVIWRSVWIAAWTESASSSESVYRPDWVLGERAAMRRALEEMASDAREELESWEESAKEWKSWEVEAIEDVR